MVVILCPPNLHCIPFKHFTHSNLCLIGKSENVSFEPMKKLFIERWGTREERDQLSSTAEQKKETDKERREKDRHYLHQREYPKYVTMVPVSHVSAELVSTADSLPPPKPKRSELVIHHDETRPTQVQANVPEGGNIVVSIAEDKRRRDKDRVRERERDRRQESRSERDWGRKSSKVGSRTTSTTPKTRSIPSSPRAASIIPLSPAASGEDQKGPASDGQTWGAEKSAWDAEPEKEQTWGAEKSGWDAEPQKEQSPQDSWEKPEWNADQQEQDWNGDQNNQQTEESWNVPAASSPRKQTPQATTPAPSEARADKVSSSAGHVAQEFTQTSPKSAVEDAVAASIASASAGQAYSPSISANGLRPRLLEGKIAAITGASRGIGRAIALGFAREGAHIVAHYWGTVSDPSNDDIVSLATEIRSMGQRCEVVFGDIADPDTSYSIVEKAVHEFGRLDIGVGNAGMCWFRDFWDITPELMRRHVDVNMNGNMWFVQACARQMKAQYVAATKTALDEDNWVADGELADIPDHSLLLVSSTTSLTASPAAAHYAASSAGILSLVQSMAVELGKYGIRCNALLPGTVMTRMVKEGVEDADKRRGMEKRVPLLGRLGRPRDVVGPAIFLAGEQSRYVTGAKLIVDGGASAGGGGGW